MTDVPTNQGGLRQRFLFGFGATALAPVVTVLIQLGSVPVLLHAWGAARYGDWLLLSAIPSYLALSDLGLSNASGSDMAMRVAANDRQGALETFQSSWVLVTLVSLAALLVGVASAWWIPWSQWLKLSSLSSKEAAEVILLLASQIVLCQQCGIAESGYRSDGRYAAGQFWGLMLRLGDATSGIVAALLGGGVLAVACATVAARAVGTIAYVLLLRRLSPWIRHGFRFVRVATIRRMAGPALGFMTMPLGFALSQQGLLLVIGAKLGPVAVVSFATLRTLSRLTYQLNNVVKNALWPELSRAFGASDLALVRRLHRYACQASLGVSILGGATLWILGPSIYQLWIHQKVAFNPACFHVLLLAVVTTSLWDTSSVVPMSMNGHCRIAGTYAVTSAVSLALAWFLVPSLGTVGAAISLFAVDAWMTGPVLRTSLALVRDNFKDFACALFAVPRLRRPTLQAVPEL